MTTQTSPVFDIVLGADETALNKLSNSIFTAFPFIFKHTFTIDQQKLGKVTIQFEAPPILSIGATDRIRTQAEDLAKTLVPPDQAAQTALDLLGSSITVSCDKVSVTIDTNSPVSAAILGGAVINVQQAPDQPGVYIMIASLADTIIDVPGQADLSVLLTELVAPLLTDYFNSSLLGQIRVPMPKMPLAGLAIPVIRAESSGDNKYLVAYSGLAPVVAPESGTAWPTGRIFIGVGEGVLTAASLSASQHFEGEGDRDGFEWWFTADIKPRGARPVPGTEAGVQVDLNCSGSAGFCYIMPRYIPDITFGGSIRGTLTAHTNVEALWPQSFFRSVRVDLKGFSDIHLDVSVDGVPGWLDGMFNGVLGPFMDFVTNKMLSSTFSGSFDLFSGLDIMLDLPGTQSGWFNAISTDHPQALIINGPNSTTLIGVTANLNAFQYDGSATRSSKVNGRDSVALRSKGEGTTAGG